MSTALNGQTDGAPQADPPRLLIVDDISDNRAVLARRFIRRGFVIFEADCGRTALEVIAREPLDIVLLDVMMGDMDGREVLKRIRETRPPSALPVIMVTARSQSEDVVEALSLGANDYITKPVDFAVALARVETQVSWARAEEAVRRANASLASANEALEGRIAARTRELSESNAQLQRAVAEAEAASRTKDEFLANVSHELRTPLNGVMGMAQMLRHTPLDPSQIEMLDVIDNSAAALRAVVTDLLDIVDIGSGRVELAAEPTDLRGLAANVAAGAQLRAGQKGLTFTMDVAPAIGTVMVDASRLGQVLLNLLSNAIKFTEQGQIAFSIDRSPTSPETVIFVVRDTGIGFEPSKAERLFERFHQADGSLTRRVGGVGLGLSICRELIQQMGGRILAEGKPGEGATFTVELPLPDHQASSEAPAGIPARPVRVLCVDDHPTNRQVLQLILSAVGVQATMAENGAEAVSSVQEQPYDAILMDMQMPVMDGLAATRAIREIEAAAKRPRTPIIMLTAHGLPEHRRASELAGADRHVTKPIVARELLSVVAELMDSAAEADQALAG